MNENIILIGPPGGYMFRQIKKRGILENKCNFFHIPPSLKYSIKFTKKRNETKEKFAAFPAI